jgi:hypothetical protein
MSVLVRRALVAVAFLVGGRAQAAEADGFHTFLRQFRTALATQDASAVAGMTRLPFLYEGEGLGREAVAGIVPTLFTPAVRACVDQATPLAEEDARVIFCPPYAFYFRADTAGRWAFESFGADGEDAP